jgi:hypothetical protein
MKASAHNGNKETVSKIHSASPLRIAAMRIAAVACLTFAHCLAFQPIHLLRSQALALRSSLGLLTMSESEQSLDAADLDKPTSSQSEYDRALCYLSTDANASHVREQLV